MRIASDRAGVCFDCQAGTGTLVIIARNMGGGPLARVSIVLPGIPFPADTTLPG